MSRQSTTNTHLESIAENVWSFSGDIWILGGMHLPVRMTVIRLSHGGLLLHSPIQLHEEVIQEIKELGEVQDILAPSLLHHLFAGDAKKAFPQARLWGVKGLQKKRGDLDFDGLIDDELPEHWQADLDGILMQGSSKTNELLLFHKPTNTLFLVDLLFNIPAPRGIYTSLLYRWTGIYRCLGQCRTWKWFLVEDREAVQKSITGMLEWPVERVVMCHGETIEQDAKQRITSALLWMLNTQKPVEKQLA